MPTSINETGRDVDVAVIGGGPAGLTAAVTLVRARRSVLVIDTGAPRNAASAGVHGFLTRDGMAPTAFLAAGRAEVESYGGRFLGGEAVAARRHGEGFVVTMADGERVAARRLIVTTGLVDELPEVPGVRELWGKDVHHCPYCHGWELDGRSVGVLGTGPMVVHQALMFRQWVDDLVLFQHTAPELDAEQAEQLAALSVRVVRGEVAALTAVDGRLTAVRMRDGTSVPRQSMVVFPRFVARSPVLTSLGMTPAPHPTGGEYFAADPTGLTEVPGVWIAGNVADLVAGVVASAAAGMTAASMANADLIAEDTRDAVRAHRASQAEASADFMVSSA